MLIWAWKTTFWRPRAFPFSSTSPDPTYIGPVVFFFRGTPFPLFWISVFVIRSSRTSSSKRSGSILRRSWNAFIKAWSSCFWFRAEEPEFVGFFISSGPSRLRFFDTWRKSQSSCFSFSTSFVASLFFFLFSVMSSRCKTRARSQSYWIPVRCARQSTLDDYAIDKSNDWSSSLMRRTFPHYVIFAFPAFLHRCTSWHMCSHL